MAVYTKAALGESYLDHDVNPFQLMIEAEQIDQSLFESLIEVDFALVYNEAGIISLTEAEKDAANNAQKEGIIKKALDFIKKIGQAIARFFDNLIAYIGNFISNDKGIHKKYGSLFNNKSSFSGCDVKGKYVDYEYMYERESWFSKALSKIAALSDKGADANIHSDMVQLGISADKDNNSGDYTLDLSKLILDSGDKPIIDVISDKSFTEMASFIKTGYKAIMNDVKKTKSEALKNIKVIEKNASKTKKDSAEQEQVYKTAVALAKATKLISSRYQTMMTQGVFNMRVCYLKLAKWAKKNGKGEGSTESSNTNSTTNTSSNSSSGNKGGVYRPETTKNDSRHTTPTEGEDATGMEEAADMLIELECMTYSDRVYEQIFFN